MAAEGTLVRTRSEVARLLALGNCIPSVVCEKAKRTGAGLQVPLGE